MKAYRKALRLAMQAMHLVKEGEPMDYTDQEWSQQEVVEMRSYLSQLRSAIDMVNKGLAMYWDKTFGDWTYDDETSRWGLSRPKGKRAYDDDTFYAWLATKNAEELAKLVSVSSIKVGGMTPVERETLLNEEPTSKDVRLTSKPLA